MGCIQSKPSKRQGLFHQQEEIIRQGNNNKDDSEKVRRSDVAISGDSVNSSFSPLLLTKLVVVVYKLNLAKHFEREIFSAQ